MTCTHEFVLDIFRRIINVLIIIIINICPEKIDVQLSADVLELVDSFLSLSTDEIMLAVSQEHGKVHRRCFTRYCSYGDGSGCVRVESDRGIEATVPGVEAMVMKADVSESRVMGVAVMTSVSMAAAVVVVS